MIRLAARVSLGGGKESAVRLALTAIGVALGVTLLLFAAVAFPALHAHDVRAAWTDTSQRYVPGPGATNDPLLWRLRTDRFDGRDILRIDVAATGPRTLVPDWLPRWPGAGELATSPSMARLLRATDPAQLGDRYPGRPVETVGADALQSSDQLVVFVGHAPDELRGDPGVLEVERVATDPIPRGFSNFLRIVLVVGALGLLIPVLVFVATATRLAAARREQRLAAMRLAGATPRQAGAIAAVEAAIAALAGTAIGFALFVLLRPYAARVPFDGYSFYVRDLRLPIGWAALIAFGVPALAVGAALVSLRRVRISPLGVTKHVRHKQPSPWRLVALGASIVLFFVSLVYSVRQSSGVTDVTQAAIGCTFALIVVAIVYCGPWLTALVAHAMGRVGRRVPSLLASRRLHDNPASGFRAISGLVLAVFVASLVSALAASAVASVGFHRSPISPTTVGLVANAQVAVGEFQREVADADAEGLDPAAATTLLRDLDGIAGVRRIVDVRALPADVTAAPPGAAPQDFGPPLAVGVVDCEGAGALKVTSCAGTTGVDVSGGVTGNQLSTLPLSRPVPRASLEALPLLGVAAFTDGRDATIERVRTQLEIAFPQAQALTGRDIYAEENWQVRDTLRLTNIALVVTLVIAGCSLAVSVAGGLVERKRPFALLRLAGMPLRQLHRVVFAEAAAPLLVVSAVSVALGFVVDAILVTVIGGDVAFRLPTLGYWVALATGLTLALVIVCATLPLLDRLTSLDSARFE